MISLPLGILLGICILRYLLCIYEGKWFTWIQSALSLHYVPFVNNWKLHHQTIFMPISAKFFCCITARTGAAWLHSSTYEVCTASVTCQRRLIRSYSLSLISMTNKMWRWEIMTDRVLLRTEWQYHCYNDTETCKMKGRLVHGSESDITGKSMFCLPYFIIG